MSDVLGELRYSEPTMAEVREFWRSIEAERPVLLRVCRVIDDARHVRHYADGTHRVLLTLGDGNRYAGHAVFADGGLS